MLGGLQGSSYNATWSLTVKRQQTPLRSFTQFLGMMFTILFCFVLNKL